MRSSNKKCTAIIVALALALIWSSQSLALSPNLPAQSNANSLASGPGQALGSGGSQITGQSGDDPIACDDQDLSNPIHDERGVDQYCRPILIWIIAKTVYFMTIIRLR